MFVHLSVCLFTYLFVVVAFLFNIPVRCTQCLFGSENISMNRGGAGHPVGIFFLTKVQILSALHSTTNLRFIWQNACTIYFG